MKYYEALLSIMKYYEALWSIMNANGDSDHDK